MRLLATSLLAISCLIAACNGNDGGKTCAPFTSKADLTTPQVSFRNDVMPILNQSCTFSSCHGAGSGTMTLRQGDAAGMRSQIVDVPSSTLPAMKRVAPGDPGHSFLMHKIDGDVCTLKDQCVQQTCGDTMPQSSDMLDEATRDVIRRWIAQGAKDN